MISTGPSVLIVEDDAAIRDVYDEVLRSAGYRVTLARDGHEAMHLLRNGMSPPCLIMMDLLMPGVDGWALAASLAADRLLASIPFVVIAAQSAPFGRLPPPGARAQLIKPVAIDEIVATVAEHCGAARGDGRPG